MTQPERSWFEREIARRSAADGLLFMLIFVSAGLLMLGVLAIAGVI